MAQSTGYSPYWIGQLAQRYNEQGAAGMVNRQHTTSRRTPPLPSSTLREELRQALADNAPGGARRWSARAVAAWMAESRVRAPFALAPLLLSLPLPLPLLLAGQPAAANPPAFQEPAGDARLDLRRVWDHR